MSVYNKKILIVSSFFPYPTFFGGAYDIFERIKGIKELGFEVDLVCTCKELPLASDMDVVKKMVSNLYLVERKNRLVDLFHLKPLQVVSRKKLKDIVLKQDYDYAILESESVGSILRNKSFKARQVILRVHNNETKYFQQLASSTKNLFGKLYYCSDSLKFRFFSPTIFSKSDRLWFISKEELSDYTGMNSDSNKAIHLPSPINESMKTQHLRSKNVLFIGALFMPNNREGLNWYLEQVHPKVMEHMPEYQLFIVGSTGNIPEETFLKEYSKYPNVQLHLNVKDLKEVYAECSVFVNPMLHGTGVKLKSINAIVNGLPLVATAVGGEGIGLEAGKMYLSCNDSNEFAMQVIGLLRQDSKEKQQMVQEAQNYLQQNHYKKIIQRELSNAV